MSLYSRSSIVCLLPSVVSLSPLPSCSADSHRFVILLLSLSLSLSVCVSLSSCRPLLSLSAAINLFIRPADTQKRPSWNKRGCTLTSDLCVCVCVSLCLCIYICVSDTCPVYISSPLNSLFYNQSLLRCVTDAAVDQNVSRPIRAKKRV